jgi:hypothetical protein
MRRRLDWTVQDPEGESDQFNVNTIGTTSVQRGASSHGSLPRVLTRIAVSQRSNIAAVSSIVPTTYQAKVVRSSKLNDYSKPAMA